MESPKLKNIVLLILVLTNLFLAGVVFRWELQDKYLEQKARQDAIAFLAGRDVTVAEDAIPRRVSLDAKTVTRDPAAEARAAAGLLGEPVEKEDRGGEIYRYYNANGFLQFHSDGAFSGTFTEGALPLGEDEEKGCLDLLKKLGFQGELLSRAEGEMTFRQRWADAPLFSHTVTVEIRDGCLTAMRAGRRLVGEPEEDASRTVSTVASALIQFRNGINALSGVCSRMDGVTEGYVSETSLSGPTKLTPVWHIATDTGTYQLNLVTGVLTRLP